MSHSFSPGATSALQLPSEAWKAASERSATGAGKRDERARKSAFTKINKEPQRVVSRVKFSSLPEKKNKMEMKTPIRFGNEKVQLGVPGAVGGDCGRGGALLTHCV